MQSGMETAAEKHVLISHAGPEAYAPMTRVILAKLGYLILLPEELESISDLADARPLVRLLDERQLAEIPDDGDGIPIILVTGRHGATGADPRIAGAVKRPVGMHELYRLIQQLSEDTPRSTPRVPTHLSARCKSEGREWTSTLLSLSENGCLVRSPEPLVLGRRLELSFELPRSGRLSLEAETAYQLLPDMGMIFHATRQSDRQAIAAFVTNTLLS
jgi:PilZ domain-containing protein